MAALSQPVRADAVLAAVNSPNKALSRAMLKSQQATARGPASFTT
jgi:hypothetical protein